MPAGKYGLGALARRCRGWKARNYLYIHRTRRKRNRVKKIRTWLDDIRVSPFALTMILFWGFIVILLILSLIED